MERKIKFSTDEFYHIYNRGSNKANIFINDSDRKRFIKLLYLCNTPKPVVYKTVQGVPLDEIERENTLVNIGAYCLMPNHFHLLLKEKEENGISRFLEKLLTGYSMYFNKKYGRTGSLFERPFKAKHADTDEYLKYLFAYIHLNPVKMIDPEWKENGIADRMKAKEYHAEYGFSSYLDYMSDKKREEEVILNKQAFPEYFANFKEFDEFINEWLDYSKVILE